MEGGIVRIRNIIQNCVINAIRLVYCVIFSLKIISLDRSFHVLDFS